MHLSFCEAITFLSFKIEVCLPCIWDNQKQKFQFWFLECIKFCNFILQIIFLRFDRYAHVRYSPLTVSSVHEEAIVCFFCILLELQNVLLQFDDKLFAGNIFSNKSSLFLIINIKLWKMNANWQVYLRSRTTQHRMHKLLHHRDMRHYICLTAPVIKPTPCALCSKCFLLSISKTKKDFHLEF